MPTNPLSRGDAMRLVTLLVLSALVAGAAHAADDSRFAGRWQPDQEANSRLMASKTPADRPARPEGATRPGGSPPGGRPGMNRPEGGPPGGRPGGDRPRDGGPRPGGPDGLVAESQASLLVAPLHGDLLIAQTGELVELGVEGQPPLQARVDGEAVALADQRTRVKVSRHDGNLVLALESEDGLKVTHTYRLEGDGQRLRILSVMEHPSSGRPIESQRLYRRP